MTSPRQLLQSRELQPKKSLGQNFLHDPNTLLKIIESANLTPHDTIVEIGPGTGSMTRLLVERAAHVIAIEVDDRLQPILFQEFAEYGNLEFHWGNILEVDLAEIVGEKPYKVVANLPYYITSAILRKLLEIPPRPQSITVTVQKEVAERIVAEPDEMSLLSVSVQFYGKPSIPARIKAAAFWPKPDVDSAVLHIELYDSPPVKVPDEKTFFKVVRAGFSQKRKQIKNSLARGLGLPNETVLTLLDYAQLDGTRRAETLTLAQWAALSLAYKNEGY